MTAAFRTDTGLLVLRLVVGVTFLLHGLDKLGGLDGVEMFFDSLGIPAPGFMATLVALTETVGGVLLIVGLLTPVAGIALAIDMLVAGLTAHADKGFFVDKGGYELVLLLGTGCVALLIAGAGRFSADALALRGRQRPAWLRTIAQQ
jgi:putative oxidoreductase